MIATGSVVGAVVASENVASVNGHGIQLPHRLHERLAGVGRVKQTIRGKAEQFLPRYVRVVEHLFRCQNDLFRSEVGLFTGSIGFSDCITALRCIKREEHRVRPGTLDQQL
mgnify:CR=1 FL=1